jgi:hypothetical protein
MGHPLPLPFGQAPTSPRLRRVPFSLALFRLRRDEGEGEKNATTLRKPKVFWETNRILASFPFSFVPEERGKTAREKGMSRSDRGSGCKMSRGGSAHHLANGLSGRVGRNNALKFAGK